MSAIVKWIHVLVIETAQDQEWVYDALKSFFKANDMRVQLMDDDDPKTDDLDS